MSLKLLILCFMWCFIPSLGLVGPDVSNFTHLELKLLNDLKHSLCASSRSLFIKDMVEPWFCVERQRCSSDMSFIKDHLVYDTNYCSTLQYSEEDPFCCHIGYIKGMEFGLEKKYIVEKGKILFTKSRLTIGLNFIQEYVTRIFYTRVKNTVGNILKDNHVCGLVPKEYKANLVQYFPLVCSKENDCNRIKKNSQLPNSVKTYIEEGAGNAFCQNTENTAGKVCCHPAAIDKNVGLNENWEVPVLLPDQKYAQGFRSSFQCEQYARYVCDNTTDNCPLESAESSKSVPGEFPYLAMIGLSYPRTQYFYCSGTVVSKYLILSASKCQRRDGKTAGVALTGDFDLWAYGEKGSSETLSEIISTMNPPVDWPAVLELVVFILRKPLVFGRFLRPACINTKVGFLDKNDPQPPGTFSGYGTVTTNGRWSQYPKKVAIDLTRDTNTDSKKCTNVPSGHKHFCYERSAGGPCEFDLGASIVYKYYRLYCQWIVFGVAGNEVQNCSSSDTVAFMIERADSYWKRLEDILYINDFDLYEFEVTWPTCDPEERSFSSKYLAHLRKRYSDIYPKNYLVPPEYYKK
uniref:Peptidase S1 domain-containing protein n=1 Tax=Graphocephala atropunctata TaxID=36148 RepID=A0A1B6KTH8_9HEMI